MWLLLILTLIAATPATAWAEGQEGQSPSRATLLADERDKKAAETTLPERSLVERGLYWYDNQDVLTKIANGWKGVTFSGGNFPAGAGMGYGVAFSRGDRVRVDTTVAQSLRGYKRAATAITLQRLAGAPLDLKMRAEAHEFPQEDFFGIGRDSREQDRTAYAHDGEEAGAELLWKPARMFEIGGGVSYSHARIGSGTDSRYPSTDQIFSTAAVPGLTAQPDYLRTDASLAFDWREEPLHPRQGGRYSVRFSDFRDQNLDAYSFRRVEVDLQQHIPLPDRYRRISVRASGTFTDAATGHEVPFFEQPTLGGSRTLRGFREFRFRDRNSLALSAEYQWEAWWALDGAFFVDAGTVGRSWRDLAVKDLDVTYGVGFRIHSNSAFVARLDLAFSREGFIPLLRFDHAF